MILGFSILVASISFLCYRHPPSTWSFLSWLQCRSIQDVAKKQQNGAAPPTLEIATEEKPPAEREEGRPAKQQIQIEDMSEKPRVPTLAAEAPSPSKVAKAKQEQDRKAMPPPPFRREPAPPSPSTPSQPLRNPSIPKFALGSSSASPDEDEDEDEDEEPSIPSFPALNSAQRASGGIRGPPRLQSQPGSGLMAPPPRSSLPNRGPPNPNSLSSSSSTLAPPPTHAAPPSKPRKKVLLTPGHSPLDWARLSSSPSSNLRGLPPNTPYLKVPPSLLKQYTGRKGKDAWTVLGGKVYNMTPYMPYHPGGEPELMKAAGRDGTRLFGEVHPWVNWEGMLEGCLVGVAVDEGDVRATSTLDEMD
ncbi:uncharacterized protein L3040_005235 [Drepanopeziza brunnea f. sp. 'multigermtubi']|uniref:Putative heme/steroid binding protein n=1 Tax=Marssonina brunnea f. sp. multigermtubi (strain MB_m1) TaxID=1072389 RepID=K1W6Q5_MARBU|nr:putative heme/steroid binding protein [Drepanopeziza brunnea f. sp. 'multigermtubi' MB_m1]EKD12650.1 putative heme/steroid binding protein [Drepanopeziza brunnea f. sp. 'multigermtubi' MB_m1]KAJ5041659.1 hypothetical protein L3040_005235 [Drepanopeziza brunnea f. sp. 'multigermtubi']